MTIYADFFKNIVKYTYMLPPTPPNVTKYVTYSIDLTCMHLGCCRDSLRKKTEQGKIRNTRLDDDSETIIYPAIEILRYWFNTTKQPKTEGELEVILDSLQAKGYEATFGCKPPIINDKKKRKDESIESCTA